MNKTRTAVHRHRSLWLSDLHLGSPACKAPALVRFLRHNDCEHLYLVGDVFDGWKLKKRFYWTPDHTRVIKAILAKARRGTKVYYLSGNHDGFLRQFVRSQLHLGPIRVVHERVHTTADGRRLLVLHGDQYDAVIRALPRLALAGDFAYETLLRASDWAGGVQRRLGVAAPWSLSGFAKSRVKSAVQYLSGFDEAIYHQCRRRSLNGVICGHTHHAEIRHVRNGVVSFNCGDWVESRTALAEDGQGRIRILQEAPAAKPAARPAAPRLSARPAPAPSAPGPA
jgi:UDP-2,3-diacylglucosamine pyrophosphatase LpxH